MASVDCCFLIHYNGHGELKENREWCSYSSKSKPKGLAPGEKYVKHASTIFM